MYCRFEEYRHIRLNRNRTRKNSLILYSICYFFPFRSFVQIYLSQRVCFYVPAFVLGTDYRMELTRVKQTRHMCVQPFVNIRIFKTMRVYFSTCLCSSSSSSSCSLLAKKKEKQIFITFIYTRKYFFSAPLIHSVSVLFVILFNRLVFMLKNRISFQYPRTFDTLAYSQFTYQKKEKICKK